MKNLLERKWLVIWMGCTLLWGCGTKEVYQSRVSQTPPPVVTQTEKKVVPEIPAQGWTKRTVTEDELAQACETDPELTVSRCKEILARLNAKAPYYISDDMRTGRIMKVPNDFRAYKNWTPLPVNIPEIHDIPRFILIDKENFFIGWYERGTLRGDTQICIGRKGEETLAGIYRVLEKDPDHYSRSYTNSYGRPAWMPWALRIYEVVWIHAGDITEPRCSHGCVTLPLDPAKELFNWADTGTLVMVIESMGDLQQDLKKHSQFIRSTKFSSR